MHASSEGSRNAHARLSLSLSSVPKHDVLAHV